MVKQIPILIGVMLVVVAGVVWASMTGFGVQKPYKKPISIREGSVRSSAGGQTSRTRYFVGGGIHRGK